MAFDWSKFGMGVATGGANQLLGLAGGQLQFWNQRKLQKEQFKLNERSAENAFARAAQMNQLTYNQESPLMKRKQLEKAGLSTSLMYSQGGGMGGAGSATSQAQAAPTETPQAPNYAAGLGESMMLGLQTATTGAQIDATKAQAEQARAQAELARAEAESVKGVQTEQIEATTEGIKLKNDFQRIENDVKGLTAQFDIAKAKSEAELIARKAGTALEEYAQAVIKTEVDNATKEANIQKAIAEAATQQAEATLKLVQADYTEAQKNALSEQIKQGWAQIALGRESNENVAKRIALDEKIWGEQVEENQADRATKILTAPLSTGAYLKNSQMKELWPKITGTEY